MAKKCIFFYFTYKEFIWKEGPSIYDFERSSGLKQLFLVCRGKDKERTGEEESYWREEGGKNQRVETIEGWPLQTVECEWGLKECK
jgi:hypothetical protein